MVTHGDKNEICEICHKKFHLKISLKVCIIGLIRSSRVYIKADYILTSVLLATKCNKYYININGHTSITGAHEDGTHRQV